MNNGEIEELEAIEEESEGNNISRPESIDYSLLEQPCIDFWKKSYEKSIVPSCLLDSKLRILWKNDSYRNSLGREKNLVGEYFTKIFRPDGNQDELESMYKSIFNADTGYSWRGKLESVSRQHLKLVVNILIFPLFRKEPNGAGPAGFGVVVDDVTEEQKSLIRGTFSSLLEASKLKDNDTGNHIRRVNEYSKKLAGALFEDPRFSEVDMEFIENIGFLAAMHDVGKIGTPDDILNKQGALDDREWEIMQEHTINGAYILSTYPAPIAREIALFHHEKWDGSGYPYRLTGDLIPLSARIVSIADVYDALRMKRSYKQPFSHSTAVDIIVEKGGAHFDPRLIEFFKGLTDEFVLIYSDLEDP